MSERICSRLDCGRKIHAQGLCGRHYQRALKDGALVLAKPKGQLHRIRNVDVANGIGECAVCGPDTPVRIRPGRGGHECQIRRRRDKIMQYGLTREAYEAMKIAQGGRCLICNEASNPLVVDHDHACCPTRLRSCGKCIRGLLCRNCNLALGYLRDSPETALAAARYLTK